ncbi:Tetratricopeptide repeat protein 4 [Phlyctochytrium planicorne]|nr:Tetratricopeptide repeat protein 4 [Phlyctochytrium planicorne]
MAGPQEKDVSELMKILEDTPLFMSKLDPDSMEDNDTMAALQSLVYDGPPDEVALNFKDQGNEAFKDGPKFYRTAIDYYSKGIAAGPDDLELKSVLYSNRAAVNLELGNFRKATNDCAEAIKLNKNNIKAYYRSVKALFAVDRFEEARDSCMHGLKVDPKNAALKAELKKIEDKMKALDDKKKRLEEEQRRKLEAELKITKALESRGITTVSSSAKRKDKKDKRTIIFGDQAKLGSQQLSNYVPTVNDEDSSLTIPVLFLYPEFNESDIISHFHEEDSFRDHFEIMFAPTDRPLWDVNKHYDPECLRVLFEARDDLDPNLPSSPHVYQVDPELPLLAALKHKAFRLVDGIATFVVTSSKSTFNVQNALKILQQ